MLNGGTLRSTAGNHQYYLLNSIITSSSGGTVDASGATVPPSGDGGLLFFGATASITINGNSNWTATPNVFLLNISGAEMPISVAPGVTLTAP